MSGSSAFANYSNTTQQLQNQVAQLAPTSTQITNDKANFEQQFLIGASLMAKQKATEKLVGLFKKSKNIESLKGKGEDAVRKLIKSAQDKVQQSATDALNKIKGVAKPDDVPAATDDKLSVLKKALRKAGKRRDATQAAKDAADEEVENSTADLAAARVSEKTATDIADEVVKTASSGADGAIKKSTIDALKARDAAQANTAAQEARAAQAVKNQSELTQKLAQHENTAQGAEQDLQNAKDAAAAGEEAATAASARDAQAAASTTADVETGVGDSEKALKAAKIVADGEKALKAAKGVEEASLATDEADPLGFIVTGLAALATQIIGRRIKAHENKVSAPAPATTFSSTLGA